MGFQAEHAGSIPVARSHRRRLPQLAVVEAERVEADEGPLPGSAFPRQRISGQVVHLRRRSNALGQVASSVVALDKHSTGVPRTNRQPAVPDVRDEERNVACLGNDRNRAASVPLEIVIGEPLPRRGLPRHVTPGYHARRARIHRAIHEIKMCCDREHRIGNPRIPRDARITRDVGSAVDVPETPEVAAITWVLPPCGVGDHMAVLTEEELHGLEDPWMTDRSLDKAAAVEHLVAEWGGLLRRISPVIGRVFLEDPSDLGAERCKLLSREDRVELDVALGLECLDLSRHRVGTNGQISPRSGWHAPILPSLRRPCDGA